MQSQDLNHLTIHEIIPPSNQIISDKISLKELETFPRKTKFAKSTNKIYQEENGSYHRKFQQNLKFDIWQNIATVI